jgi:nitroimidazol reductase NimA-like FMN-containing flavoprotein (pyridoxamine 5'-phosphate oxidase superfamily)
MTRQEPEIDHGQPLEVLDRAECVELLTHGSFVGRLGLVVDGRPLVLPVNYMVDRDTIVFCTAAGTKLNAIVGGADVAFEVDESRSLVHSGWSVLVRGRAQLVTDEADLAHLRAGPLRPWARGARSSWVRIALDVVSGRRIAPI